MVIKNKSIIAKGVFAVAVVAVTATVGIVGFAQAAHRPGSGAANGYGTGGQVRAAVQQFERALRTASRTFRQDVRACLNNAHDDLAARGDTARPTAENQFQSAANGFEANTDENVSEFSAKVASPDAVSKGPDKFNDHYKQADNDSRHRFDDADNQLNGALDSIDNNRNRGQFSQCIQTARNKYQDAVRTAQQQLLDALRHIFG